MYNWAYVHIVSPVRQSLIVYHIRKGWQNLKKKKRGQAHNGRRKHLFPNTFWRDEHLTHVTYQLFYLLKDGKKLFPLSASSQIFQ